MPDLRSALSRPLAAVLVTACLAFVASAAGVGQLPPASPSYDFDKDIKPILEANCVRCHGEKRQKSDFRLDTRQGLVRGGEENEKVFIAGHSDKSPLIRQVAGLVPDLQMPPVKDGPPLTAKQIGLLRAWIDAGATYPAGTSLVNTNASADTAEAAETEKIAAAVLERGKDHWAFKPPVRPTPPAVTHPAWAKTPIDAFVLARLEKEGLAPASEADQATLLRRLSSGPHRPAADARGARGVPRRRRARRLHEAGRAPPAPRRTTASAGPVTGSTPRATPTATASRRTSRATSGPIATGSSTPSTATCPTTSSSSNRSPATCCPMPRRTRSSPPASCGTRWSTKRAASTPSSSGWRRCSTAWTPSARACSALTIQCAQCHNHKFDPIPQEEYYKLFAFLNNDHEAQQTGLPARAT